MASGAPVAKIDIGRVISQGFEALRANFLPFFAISALLAGAPAFFLQYWVMSGLATAVAAGDPNFILSIEFWALPAGLVIATAIAWALLQGVLVRSTILFLSGREADLPQSVARALRLLLPIIAISIIVTVLSTIGFFFLIVPGFMIYCAFAVTVPALIEERHGIFGSLQRSRDLTRGSRKRIFVLLIVFWIFSVIISTVLSAITSLFEPNPAALVPDPILAGAASAVGSALTSAIVAVSVAALYVELRTVREGATTNDLAAIFE